jgi:endonuclease III
MPRESKANLKKRSAEILEILRGTYPDAKCSLNFRSPLQLLIATILSAQTTDVQVNIVTKDLFRKYRTPRDYANASQEQLQEDIHSIGFFRNKSKSLRGTGAKIVEDFDGKVPDTMDELLTLPGVARKTANVVLGNAFGKNEGIVVDTHVSRLAPRLGLSRHKKTMPHKIEQDLMELIPRDDWCLFSHLLVFHGRAVCSARKPNCGECPLKDLCPSAFKV